MEQPKNDKAQELMHWMTQQRIENTVRQHVQFLHVQEYHAKMQAKYGARLGQAIIRERGLNHCSPIAYWPGDSRVSWHIRPSLPMLEAMGFAVKETMDQVQAMEEKPDATEH